MTAKKRKTKTSVSSTNGEDATSSERIVVFFKLTVDEWTKFAAVAKHGGWSIQDGIRALVAAEIAREDLDEMVTAVAGSLAKRKGSKVLAAKAVARELVASSRSSPWNASS
jgi:hypothetical protein